jgi:hypothetical protein
MSSGGAAIRWARSGEQVPEDENPLIGIWVLDQGFQTVELVFRSNGRYLRQPHSTDPVIDAASGDGGHYELLDGRLSLVSYTYSGEPPRPQYFETRLDGASLTLISLDPEYSLVYQFRNGSRADVLAREQVEPVPVGAWTRIISYGSREELTFRPGGYYFLTSASDGSAPQVIRGRYGQQGMRLSITPYSGIEAQYELDFFGNTLALIKTEELHGECTTYEKVPGSGDEVRARTAEAEAFLSRENWQVGTWEVRETDPLRKNIDLTLRPDGHYTVVDDDVFYGGIVRGRYSLDSGRIHFQPFVGQGLYSRNNSGEFGQTEHTRALDYYDGQLQLIDPGALSQSVTLARKRTGSDEPVLRKAAQAAAERARQDWCIGTWEVNDPAGWMEFTFRPDNCYVAMLGSDRLPSQVERGEYVIGSEKITLAPYPGLGPARGFELDLYDGNLFLVGDLQRMVVARKAAGSETSVVDKTRNPESMKGERGSVIGVWTANLPGQSAELVFRPDGEFRLRRCINSAVSRDYGLYSVDMATRTLVSDSRFLALQTLGLDFYGDTLTIFGGNLGPPSTYTVNLGMVDAAVQASLAADAEESQVDAEWLTRVTIGPRDPKAVQVPTADIPADPNPSHAFDVATVFRNFTFYRRLLPGFVYFNVSGTIRTVPVVNTQEWYLFPTGRALVRIRNYRAGWSYPMTDVDISDSWAAYRIEPKPDQRDILHVYADNALFVETDSGELVELTLENGRRHLFWNKDYQILLEWATEQQPIPCQLPSNADPKLVNTGIALSTAIEPDVT